ncbi:uncharacterized protein LOC133849745 [Drosophila sulfurigaster albostrigata]|uniref:uncharacterized protein LOC133849745 n=1 Tax=Drosophila sulfurigaster albostrigata TaxID=89887 RepID=UPI002D219A5D|nr:uncharacterized protein LOC133849745 [Drosophila sulfurigaster albostrigata]
MFSIRSRILYLLLLARHSGFWSGLASERVCPGFVAFAQVFPGQFTHCGLKVSGLPHLKQKWSSSRTYNPETMTRLPAVPADPLARLAGLRCHLFHFRGWTLVTLRWDFNLINGLFDSCGYLVCCPCDERPRRLMYRSTSIHSWRNSSTFTVSRGFWNREASRHMWWM